MFNNLKTIWKIILSADTKKNIFTTLKNTVREVGGEITRLDYYPEHFGNIILHFQKDGTMYEYVVDRGDIYFKRNGVCNDSYFSAEGKQPYQKLIEVIKATAN